MMSIMKNVRDLESRGTMKKNFLFDLDGTVLRMEADEFINGYFRGLGAFFADLMDPRKLAKLIMESTERMCADTSDEDNYTVFFKHFKELSGEDMEVFEARFDRFYEEKFEGLKGNCSGNPGIIEAIHLLKEKGYSVVLATNPVFPMKANEHRLRWAGLEPEEFLYITALEICNKCKPNPDYFRNILKHMNWNAEECVMVGNDVIEDLSASEAGIETWLIEDCKWERENAPYIADHVGTGADFLEYVKGLERCTE